MSLYSYNKQLFDFLSSNGYDHYDEDHNLVPGPSSLDVSGNSVSPQDAEVFQIQLIDDEKDRGPVTISFDGDRKLVVYFDSRVENSKSWYKFMSQLKQFRQTRGITMELKKDQSLKSDMKTRQDAKKLDEGYYPMGKSASYSNDVPSIKIILQHTRQIQEGEQRFVYRDWEPDRKSVV